MRHVVGTLQVEPLDATFGAVVRDVVLRRASDATIAELTELWLEYALLVFPGQHLTQPEQDEFARRFGDLEFTATPLTNIQRDGTLRATEHDLSKSLRGNERWHHDSTYMPVQAKGAVFTAEILPDEGGDTGFADMRAAYDALDDATRERIDGLAAYHSRRYSMDRADLHVSEENADRYQLYGYGIDIEPPLRPLVKVHPATGRPNLLIGQHAHAIAGLRPTSRRHCSIGSTTTHAFPRAPTSTRGRKGMRCCGTTGASCTGRRLTIPDKPGGCGTPGSPETRRPNPASTTEHRRRSVARSARDVVARRTRF